MLRPEGATAFRKCRWSEGASWVDLMITAIWIVVCQNLPMDMREEILTNEVLEGSSMSTGSNTSFDIERTSMEKVSPGRTENFQEARVLVSTMVGAIYCCPALRSAGRPRPYMTPRGHAAKPGQPAPRLKLAKMPLIYILSSHTGNVLSNLRRKK